MSVSHRRWHGLMAAAVMAAIALACMSGMSRADGSINLNWDECAGNFGSGAVGTHCKLFACNTNTQTTIGSIIASFVPPSGMNAVVGVSAYVDIHSTTGPLPDWWKLGSGQCRPLGTSRGVRVNFDFTSGPLTCLDPWEGQAAGAGSFTMDPAHPDHGRLAILIAIADPVALDPASEYYAFKLDIGSAKSTGAGSCGGCSQPVTVTLDTLQLVQQAQEANDPFLTASLISNQVLWQCPTHMIAVDARTVGQSFQVGGSGCLDGTQIQDLTLPEGDYTFQGCTIQSCSGQQPPPGMKFAIDSNGNVTYDPILEGVLQGAGTSTLVVRSFPFPPPGDDFSPSMGVFRVEVEPRFWNMMSGYPGYGVVNGVHRLVSPPLYEPSTRIGRSRMIRHGSADDLNGVPVGTAGTVIKDSDFAIEPPGFQGPDGTLELHTELRAMNLTGSGAAIRAGSGNGLPICPGEIEANPGGTSLFPAESFFNVYVEADLPMLGTLHNLAPLVVENSNVNCFPPQIVYIHRHTGPVPLLFKTSGSYGGTSWSAGDQLGWLVLAGHGYDFDTTGAAAARGAARSGRTTIASDPFAELMAAVNAEPELADTATTLVDLHDVIASTPTNAYVQPAYRDSLANGIDQMAMLGQSGDPCAGTRVGIYLYQRVDGLGTPADWVQDTTVRRVFAERIHALGAQLQAQANQHGGCAPAAVGPEARSTRVMIQSIRPNPATSVASIDYAVPVRGRVKVVVYDLSGRLVRTLVNADLEPGVHEAIWDGAWDRAGGRRVESGTYFVRLSAAGESQTKRFVMVK